MTGDLADAIHRDLRIDRLTVEELGWRDLWAYVTKAPPNTAIHYARCHGWTTGDRLAAEQLYEERKLGWRYTRLHFEDGDKIPFPDPVDYPGRGAVEKVQSGMTLDELVSAEVRALLQGG